jgi:hypothetical protein
MVYGVQTANCCFHRCVLQTTANYGKSTALLLPPAAVLCKKATKNYSSRE